MAMTPDEQGIFYTLIVQGGPGSGEFVYDANGSLRSSNVGQSTTDPLQGLSCPQGFATWNGHGAIVNLLSTADGLGAFYQYFDHQSAVQGALILSVSSIASTDPVTGAAYNAGLRGIDPVFGDFMQVTGSLIQFGVGTNFTRLAQIQAVIASDNAHTPYLRLDAPEQVTADHLQMAMQGDSPDGTKFAQLLIGRVSGNALLVPASTALLEVQGDIDISTAGNGLRVKEGTNARMGLATLAAGTTGAIANTSVTANTRIFTSRQLAGGTLGELSETRVAGTSFTINSSSNLDTSTVAWLLMEPG